MAGYSELLKRFVETKRPSRRHSHCNLESCWCNALVAPVWPDPRLSNLPASSMSGYQWHLITEGWTPQFRMRLFSEAKT